MSVQVHSGPGTFSCVAEPHYRADRPGPKITFWVGAVLAGPEAVKRGKGWLPAMLQARRVRTSR